MISNIKYPRAIAKHTLFKDKSDILALPKKETKLISGSSDLREQYGNKDLLVQRLLWKHQNNVSSLLKVNIIANYEHVLVFHLLTLKK